MHTQDPVVFYFFQQRKLPNKSLGVIVVSDKVQLRYSWRIRY